MARSQHLKDLKAISFLTEGQITIFSQRSGKGLTSNKPRPEPALKYLIENDYRGLLKDFLIALKKVVDEAYPNADFLQRKDANNPNGVEGSGIIKNTKLSSVMSFCYNNLIEMSSNTKLVKNYQKTLTKYLDNIQHASDKKEEYTELRNIKKIYKNLSKALVNQQLIEKELHALEKQGQQPKTIDRHLQLKWVEPYIQEPIKELTAKTDEAMRSCSRLASKELAGICNSLISLTRLVTVPNTTQHDKKHRDNKTSTEFKENDTLIYSQSISMSF